MAANGIAESIKAARLAQIDARLAELDDERAALTEKRKAYAPRAPRRATAKKD